MSTPFIVRVKRRNQPEGWLTYLLYRSLRGMILFNWRGTKNRYRALQIQSRAHADALARLVRGKVQRWKDPPPKTPKKKR